MPFKSGKQRRYLWANEPEIARDWTKKYGSRVRKVNGGIMDKIMPYVYPKAHAEKYATRGQWAKDTPQYHRDITENYFDELSKNWSQLPYVGKPAAAAIELFAPGATGIMNLPYDTYSAFKKFYENPQKYEDPGKWGKVNDLFPGLANTNVAGILSALDREDMFSAAGNRFIGAARPLAKRMQKGWDAIKNEFSGSAQAGEPDKNNYSQEFADLYKQGKYDNLSLAMQDADRYNRGETTNYEKIIGKNPITDIYDRDYTAGEHYNMTPDARTRAMRQDLKSVPDHTRRQTNFPISTAQQFANLGQPHKGFEEMDPERPQKKGLWDTIKGGVDTVRGGITNVLDNTMIGKIAALNNPFNPRAANYQPGFRESVDQYRKQGLVSPGGKVMSGPMQGYNMVSGFGSNNYRNMISNRMNKQGMFGLRGPNNEIRNQQKYNELKAELQKETQRQRDLPSTAPGMGGQSYNQYVDRMVQDRSPERRGKPGGIGGKELMAQGGLASLWPR